MRPLTPRELEIIALISEGKHTSEITAQLGITASTLRTHKTHIFYKTQTRNMVQLANWYHWTYKKIKKDLTSIDDSSTMVGEGRTQ
jgi:DNA-binding CsgD family transcriptional regulator